MTQKWEKPLRLVAQCLGCLTVAGAGMMAVAMGALDEFTGAELAVMLWVLLAGMALLLLLALLARALLRRSYRAALAAMARSYGRGLLLMTGMAAVMAALMVIRVMAEVIAG